MSLDTLKTAKKTIGVKQVTKAVEKDLVQTIYIAQDAEQRLVEQLWTLCSEKNVPVDQTTTMAELGKACSIEVGAAAVAVLK
jgi:large subunit ribosomal protein L7A